MNPDDQTAWMSQIILYLVTLFDGKVTIPREAFDSNQELTIWVDFNGSDGSATLTVKSTAVIEAWHDEQYRNNEIENQS